MQYHKLTYCFSPNVHMYIPTVCKHINTYVTAFRKMGSFVDFAEFAYLYHWNVLPMLYNTVQIA